MAPSAAFTIPLSLTLRASRARLSARCTTRIAVSACAPQPGAAKIGDTADGGTDDSAATAAAATLRQAAAAYVSRSARPSSSLVSDALVTTERNARRLRTPVDGESLRGQWRLVLTRAVKPRAPLPEALYFPVDARATFSGDGEGPIRFDNCVRLGNAARLTLTGPARWTAARSLLAFTFTEVAVRLGPLRWSRSGLDKEGDTLEGRKDGTLPFFTFFLVTGEIAAARGRSGGLALWARLPDTVDEA